VGGCRSAEPEEAEAEEGEVEGEAEGNKGRREEVNEDSEKRCIVSAR
jgi:hypothetical protein